MGNRKQEAIEEKDQNKSAQLRAISSSRNSRCVITRFPPGSALIVDERVKNLMRGSKTKEGGGEGEAITKKTAWSRPEQDLGLLMALFRLPKARASRWGMAASARQKLKFARGARGRDLFLSFVRTLFFSYITTRELTPSLLKDRSLRSDVWIRSDDETRFRGNTV